MRYVSQKTMDDFRRVTGVTPKDEPTPSLGAGRRDSMVTIIIPVGGDIGSVLERYSDGYECISIMKKEQGTEVTFVKR